MQKADLINLVIVRSPGTPEQLKKLRQQLSWKTIAELGQIVDEQNAQIRAEAVPAPSPRVAGGGLHRIFQIPINGKVAVRNEAAERIIEGWVDEIRGDVLSPEWFIQVLKETPQLANQLQWQSADVLDPRKQAKAAAAQDQQDRETFNTFAKMNGFSLIEANFYLAKSVLGTGLGQYALIDAVNSGQLHLAQASREELAEFQQEAQQAREAYLNSLPLGHPERQTAAEQRRQEFQRAEQERQIAQREKADAQYDGYVPLPEFNLETGDKIDAAYLNRISNTNLQLFKALMRKHGGAALTRRLNGRG